jgi:hypothetical protein
MPYKYLHGIIVSWNNDYILWTNKICLRNFHKILSEYTTWLLWLPIIHVSNVNSYLSFVVVKSVCRKVYTSTIQVKWEMARIMGNDFKHRNNQIKNGYTMAEFKQTWNLYWKLELPLKNVGITIRSRLNSI